MTPGGPRIVLVTGKGGVGKTTVAAAMARAHVLRGGTATFVEFGDGDSGRRVLGGASRVRHEVITSATALEAAANELFGSAIIARAVTGNFAVKRILRAAPALRELAQLEAVRRIAAERPRDLVVVDMPASGHGLAWLRVPERLETVLVTGPLHKMAARVRRDVVSADKSTVVIVTLPETLVIEETLELAAALERELALRAGAVVVNRVPPTLPPEARDAIPRLTSSEKHGDAALAFVDARRAARDEVQRALERTQSAEQAAHMLPLWPTDPELDRVAEWLSRKEAKA